MKRVLIFLALATPAGACANGAMGLGLEMWAVPYWAGYVIAMVLAEAWLIGRWLGLSWPASIALSAVANFVTGAGCGMMGCPFLHYPIVGSRENPNPLANSIAILSLFSVPSAIFESLVWNRFRGIKTEWALVGRSVIVHVALVPLGLAILLIPPRPYVGLEATTRWHRSFELRRFARDIYGFTSDTNRFPEGKDPLSIFREVQAWAVKEGHEPITPESFAITLTDPAFGRFDTSGKSGQNWEVNPRVVGRKIPDEPQKDRWTWYMRPVQSGRISYSIATDLSTGATKVTGDPKLLQDLPD